MAADRDDVSAVELAALQGRITHHLIEEGPPVEHISDDGLHALCGGPMTVDVPTRPPCPACQERASRPRYVWPRIGPASLAMLWLIAMCVGRWEAGLSVPARMAGSFGALVAVLALVTLAGRVRPTKQGGEE